METRKKVGLKVVIFLALLTIMFIASNARGGRTCIIRRTPPDLPGIPSRQLAGSGMASHIRSMFRSSAPLSPLRRRVGFVALVLAVLAAAIISLDIRPGDAARRTGDMLMETVVGAAAPLLAYWIADSRDALASEGAPVPPDIAAQLNGYFSQTMLKRARHHVGWPEGLAGLAFRLTGLRAITLDHVIIFRNQTIAADSVIWAHELAHARQFETWGVSGFAERYLRDREGIEREAWQIAMEYKMWALQTGRLE